jgi:pimeloyl-ACP methyl ester carboxylesterase
MTHELARYWGAGYDWRKCEAKLNDLPHFRLDRGGHFAAWEQPDLFAAEMRASFRSVR